MALGFTGRVAALDRALSPARRYTDLAIDLCVYRATSDGQIEPTGERTRIGGRWDCWTGGYADSEPEVVLERPLTAAQYAYCLCRAFRITGAGGRGGGKSEALASRAECLLLTRPGEHGIIVSPDYAHTQIVWGKILRRTHQWTLPGTQGIHRTEHLIRYITGSTIRFLSADNPDSLRGWDAHWMGVDEEKDVTDEAIDIGAMCLRESADPLIFGAGTPEVGEYSARYEHLMQDPSSEVFRFPSYENVFIPHEIFERMKSHMDERRYRQEVLAEFVRMDDDALVAKGFSRNRHCANTADLGADITSRYLSRKGFINPKTRRTFRFIAGVDYNHDSPCVAWIYQVYPPNRWVVVDIVKAPDPAHRLAQALKDAGYRPQRVLVVDDASAEWQDARGSKRSPNTSRRFMREAGFTCVNPDSRTRRNPPVRERIDAFLAKLSPAAGDPTWAYSAHLADRVVPVMENQVWSSTGWTLDKDAGYDHDMDAATYPIHRLEPPYKYGGRQRGAVR